MKSSSSSSFVTHLLRPLAAPRPGSPSVDWGTSSEVEPTNELVGEGKPHRGHVESAVLQALLHDLDDTNTSFVPERVEHAVNTLQSMLPSEDRECESLKRAVVNALVVSLYAQSIQTCLAQATETETEAEWWADVERSHWNAAWYLLQTIPVRVVTLGAVVARALRTQNMPVTLSNLSPSSLRRLFPSTDPLRPDPLSKALFPHLRHQSFNVAPSAILSSEATPVKQPRKAHVAFSPWRLMSPLLSWVSMPVELARQECHFKRRALEKIRDQKAEALGYLAQLRGELAAAFEERSDVGPFVYILACIVRGEQLPPSQLLSSRSPSSPVLPELLSLSGAIFDTQRAEDHFSMNSMQLRRPSWLVLSWPKLLLLPPLSLYALRTVYASRATLFEVALDATETVRRFFEDWLINPIKDVIKTVRAGGEEGVIVRREGVLADLESLERMALSLAKDELQYGPQELQDLSKQVKQGDLTAILRLYEEDIRNPLKSALAGTLLRSLFIQVQKAKVDIDQALAGIDRLLKSQELTFAFVGVAPALGVTYLFGSLVARLARGGAGRGRYGGKRRRSEVWSAMRRIERLLVSQQPRHHHKRGGAENEAAIPPLISGLLLLSVARLRTFGETYLQAESKLREGFLEDVVDLENPDLGRGEKMRVVERMWRCWGDVFGWRRIAGQGTV